MRGNGRLRILALAVTLVIVAALSAWSASPSEAVAQVRMSASTSLIGSEVNVNDAKAALTVWADTFSLETGLRIVYLPEILFSPEQLYLKVRSGQLDVFSLTTQEYLKVMAYTDQNLLLVDESYASGGEEYLVLVHAESGIKNLAELRGRSLIRFSAANMCLASDWLAVALAGANLGAAEAHFGQITISPKASRTVLPVFFRQADACLVTRRAFDAMAEMNPQLAVKLRVVSTSPKVVPIVVAFHKDCSPAQKERFRSALINLGNTPAGRQILALFGARHVRAAGASVLGSAFGILAASNRLKAHTVASRD